MQFSHDPAMRAEFPQLDVATLTLDGVTGTADVAATAAPFLERASARLAERPESEIPEIAAWRRTFRQMGLKPTQYRCASEALLRRFKKDGELPIRSSTSVTPCPSPTRSRSRCSTSTK
ncbi:hypothetical protein [Marisediminicola sp. LYQ134]|uniref:hypothetical protein n=1 Tax=Marisediminicola sp. LYQ134 TaxID=3391061 RepID=UPI003982DEF1